MGFDILKYFILFQYKVNVWRVLYGSVDGLHSLRQNYYTL